MNRRKFIVGFGSAATAWPLSLYAQQPARRPRLGILIYSTPDRDPATKSFLGGIRELGYVDGQNIDIERLHSSGGFR